MKSKFRDLLPEELAAVQIFAAENGRSWKDKLAFTYWYNARVFRDSTGKSYEVLHRMRNELGPRWLTAFKLPKGTK